MWNNKPGLPWKLQSLALPDPRSKQPVTHSCRCLLLRGIMEPNLGFDKEEVVLGNHLLQSLSQSTQIVSSRADSQQLCF